MSNYQLKYYYSNESYRKIQQARQNTKIQCLCGSIIMNCNFYTHLNSKKHSKLLERNYEQSDEIPKSFLKTIKKMPNEEVLKKKKIIHNFTLEF